MRKVPPQRRRNASHATACDIHMPCEREAPSRGAGRQADFISEPRPLAYPPSLDQMAHAIGSTTTADFISPRAVSSMVASTHSISVTLPLPSYCLRGHPDSSSSRVGFVLANRAGAAKDIYSIPAMVRMTQIGRLEIDRHLLSYDDHCHC